MKTGFENGKYFLMGEDQARCFSISEPIIGIRWANLLSRLTFQESRVEEGCVTASIMMRSSPGMMQVKYLLKGIIFPMISAVYRLPA